MPVGSGSENDLLYGAAIDLTGTTNPAIANTPITDGKFYIASTALNAGGTHSNVGGLNSPLGTVTIGYNSPNITLDIAGGGAYISLSPFIVGTDSHSGYSTIQAGINAAVTAGASSSAPMTVYIKPKVDGSDYTENPTLSPGVNLVGFGQTVTINGQVSYAGAGTVNIQGLRLQTNSSFALAVTGSAASIVNVLDCYFNCVNNTGISYTTSNAAAELNIYNSQGNLGTTGISWYAMSSTGYMYVFNCEIFNTGLSSTASNSAAGTTILFYCYLYFPFSSSSTATFQIFHSQIYTKDTNSTALTHNGTGGNCYANYTSFETGSGAAISVGASAILQALFCHLDGTAVNMVTGAGTIEYNHFDYVLTGANVNTTTQIVLQGNNVVRRTVVSSSPYTVLATDQYLSVDTTSARTIKLPNAPSTNQIFTVKDQTGSAATNNITVTTVGGAVVIDGSTTDILNENYEAHSYVFNGTSYEISKAYQPSSAPPSSPVSFSSYVGTTLSGVTGSGVNYHIIFDSTLYDTNSAYNTSTGVFTAPNTGYYFFNTTIQASGLVVDETILNIYFIKNAGSGVANIFNAVGNVNPFIAATSGFNSFNGSAIFAMTAGDTMQTNILVTSGAGNTVNIYSATGNGNYSYFQGYQIH